jgi:hypothetical protein
MPTVALNSGTTHHEKTRPADGRSVIGLETC